MEAEGRKAWMIGEEGRSCGGEEGGVHVGEGASEVAGELVLEEPSVHKSTFRMTAAVDSRRRE
jgi:hypothetical protein